MRTGEKMKERPILFSGPMIRAILDGRKTQTRRLLAPQPDHLQVHEWKGKPVYDGEHRLWCWKEHTFENLWDEYCREDDRARLAKLAPYGVPGDRLWVRETWTHDADSLDECRTAFDCHSIPGYGPYYLATEVAPDTLKWKPSIFMPRWASRITLEITEVRVQRLQEIGESDARAEGCRGVHGAVGQMIPGPPLTARADFEDLWDSINAKRAAWASNPWVWALTFKRLP